MKYTPADAMTYTGYIDPPKPYLVDVGDYLFYHVLHVEYLVQFSKNPTPYQKPLSLPHCGLASRETLDKRGWRWPTASDIETAFKKAVSDLANGIAAIRK